jgi:hypothetical protein
MEFLSGFSNAIAMFETYACYFNYLSKVEACVCPYDSWFNYVLVMFNWSFILGLTHTCSILDAYWSLRCLFFLDRAMMLACVLERISSGHATAFSKSSSQRCNRIKSVFSAFDKSLVYPVLFLCYLADWPWCHDMLLFWVPMWYWSNGVNSFVLESCRASLWEYVLHYVWLIWFACLLS